MKKTLVAVVMALAVVLAVPVVASAQESDEPATPDRPPVELEERFETVGEAISAITERMNNRLERLTERLADLQEDGDASEARIERISGAIENVEQALEEVAGAESFDELNSIMEELREQRREARADRPHRCGPRLGNSAETAAEVNI